MNHMLTFRPRLAPAAAMLALGLASMAPLTATAQDYSRHHRPHHRTHTVCRDVRVKDSRDHNRVAGTAIGAVAGGLLGHTIGGGNGKTIATVGGAVAGGYVGNRVQARNQREHWHMERRCWQE